MCIWITKLHKNPIGSRLIKASKNSSNKLLPKAVSKKFKLIFSQVDNFHHNSIFISNYNKFWVLQIVDLVSENINILNRKKKVKSTAAYDFSTSYATHSLDKLIKSLCNVIVFVFQGGNRTHVCLSKKNVAYWRNNFKDNVANSNIKLKIYLKNHIENCCFMAINSLLRQKIGLPMRITQVNLGKVSDHIRMKPSTCLNLFQLIK